MGDTAPDKVKGYLLALLSAALHAGVPVAGKYAMNTMHMNTMTYSFLWVALIVLYTWLFFTLSGRWPAALAQVRLHWKSLLVMGLLQTLGVWTFFAGVKLLDPTVAAFFGRASAVFSLILGLIFLRERFNRREAAGIALAIIGAFIISWAAGSVVILGMLGVVSSCLCFALFTFIAKVKAGRIAPFVLISASTTVSAVALGIYGAATSALDFHVHYSAYLAIAAAAFCGSFLGIAAFYASFNYIGFAVASTLRSAQTIFVALLSFFTLGLLPDLKGWLGGSIIIIGVTVITLSGRKSPPPIRAPLPGDADA